MNIKNKKIWVTGASSGIGEALAIECAEQGAKLVLSARNEDKLHSLKKQLVNSECHYVLPLDLANSAQVTNIANDYINKHGPVDILINNGGISQRGSARETKLDVQRKVMEVNYFGTIALTQAVFPSMTNGMIVTISSVAGKVGGKSMSGYSASKHAIIGYMDCLRAEESMNGLHVLTICPGFVQTKISVNAMVADGGQFGKVAGSIKHGITVDDCAKQIIKAIEAGKNEVVIGKGISYWAPTIARLFPNTFRKMTAKKNVRD
jgi:short-subunit dehydrogenase